MRPLHAALFALVALAGCSSTHLFGGGGEKTRPAVADLTGAWHSSVKFSSGPFVGMNGLEFMYVFNQGGTLTESSNFDAAPPVPPAYGTWLRTGPAAFHASYEFFLTRPPLRFDDIARGGGWLPAGHGVFSEEIQLSADGKTFTSKIKYQGFDASGKPAADKGEADGNGVRFAP